MDTIYTNAAPALADIYELFSPFLVELCFVFFFALGFRLFSFDSLVRNTGKPKGVAEPPPLAKFDPRLHKQVAMGPSSTPEGIAQAWRAGRDGAPTPADLLRPVVKALLEVDADSIVSDLIEHFRSHLIALGNAKMVLVVLDEVARAGKADVLEQLAKGFRMNLRIAPTIQTFEVLLMGYASAGDERRVATVIDELSKCRRGVSARGFLLTIKGFLHNGLIDSALQKLREMQDAGFQIPPFAVVQLFKAASEKRRVCQMFDEVVGRFPLCAEAVSIILDDCLKQNNVELAKQVEKQARAENISLKKFGAFDPLVKLYAFHADLHAIDIFQEMQEIEFHISEGLCVGLLARCGDARFPRFAEEVVRFCRSRRGMTICVYSALMKVYAYCGMYAKACDLYEDIVRDGLEPDAMMYGCLMKFAVECGRTDLSHKLSQMTPKLDIQNYMSLIRAAGRDKDIDRAFGVLGRLKESGVKMDAAAYNCVLDVCVSVGDMDRATSLVEEMKQHGTLNLITYNTLLKGYSGKVDLRGAKKLLREMRREGINPDDVSYNCVVHTAVSASSGDLREAWETVDEMERHGIKVDRYTVSIMLKAMRRVNPRDVNRALALLDRSGLDVYSDEILLNTVLETCIRHREYRRLENVLSRYRTSGIRPDVHTYSSLIKAAGTLKRVNLCWEYWQEMEQHRGIEPNDIVLGCMLDALATNRQVDQATQLFAKWKAHMPSRAVMYSTILKGLAITHQAGRAMQLWRSMREEGISMSTVIYNVVIDAQARVGAMQDISELVATMAIDGVSPDNITHSTIVKGYCTKGDLDRAWELLRSMQTGSVPNDSVYNTILDGCTRKSRFDLADLVLEEMEKNQVVPTNFTLGTLVNMYGRRNQLEKAFQCVEEIPRKHGFTLDTRVKASLICACLKNRAVDRALQVFEELKQSGDAADGKACSSILSGLVRNKNIDRAVRLVDEAYGLNGGRRALVPGQHLQPDALEDLLQAILKRGEKEEVAIPLLERLRPVQNPAVGRLYASLLGSQQGAGD